MASSDYRIRLREKALEILNKEPENFDNLDKETVKYLFQELQVHQIELEIQNEELRNIQSTMEANRVRYTSLFDNAPVGYVILDQVGIIKQFNNTFYNIVKNNNVMGKQMAFAELLTEKSAHKFRSRFRSFLRNPTGKNMEATILDADEVVKNVVLELSTHTRSQNGSDTLPDELLVTVTDITEFKQVETQLQEALDDVRQLSGLIPICSHCRRIRDDKGFWESLDNFISTHSDNMFTHGMCPDCSDELYGDSKWYQEMKARKKARDGQ